MSTAIPTIQPSQVDSLAPWTQTWASSTICGDNTAGCPRPQFSRLPPVPLEGNTFALNSLQPLTELMYTWETSDRTAMTGRSGFAIFDASGDNYTQFQQSLGFDVMLTERLGAFVSWDMLADHGSWNDTSQHMAGGGLSFLLTERFAVSWRSAAGLNSAAPEFLIDIRFAHRF